MKYKFLEHTLKLSVDNFRGIRSLRLSVIGRFAVGDLSNRRGFYGL